MGEHSKPSYERLTTIETAELPKMGQALGSSEQPAVSGIVPSSPAPLREEIEAPAASAQPIARRQPVTTPTASRPAPSGGVISRLLGWFRSAEPAAPTPAPKRTDGNDSTRDRRDERAGRGNAQNTSAQRQPRREQAQQNGPKSNAQQPRNPRQRNNEQQPPRQPQHAQAQNAKPERQPKPAVTGNNPARTERKPNPQQQGPKAERPARPSASERPAAASPSEAAKEAELLIAPLGESTAPESSDDTLDADGSQSRRRRGRRGGRRRRRHDEVAANGTNLDAGQVQALDDEDRDEAVSATEVSRREQPSRTAPVTVNPVVAVAAIGADLTNNAPVSNAAPEVAQETARSSALMPASAVPVEKAVTRVADPALDDSQPSKPELTPSAAAPTVATFNLPTLPPIPDQPKPVVSDSDASEAVKVAVPPAAPMPAQPISHPPQQATAANTDKVSESVAEPVTEAVPAPRPAVVVNPPAPAVTPAPQARPAISPEPVAPISEPTSATPAVVVPAPLAPLPKQGDLLAYPIHPAASIAPRDEEHKSDLHD